MDALKVVLSSLILAALAGASAGEEITPEEFERLHKDIRHAARHVARLIFGKSSLYLQP